MSPDEMAFGVRVCTSDFKVWIEVNEYINIVPQVLLAIYCYMIRKL